MAFCTNCGKQVEGGGFCPNCGTPVSRPGAAPPGQAPGGRPVPPPAGYDGYPGRAPRSKFPVWAIVLIVALAFVVVAGAIVAVTVPIFLNANTLAQKRTCQANQRTIDAAIQTYYAENGSYPPAGPVGKVLVPDFMKKAPTCPTSGKPYTITRGNPPTTSCPTNVPGHNI